MGEALGECTIVERIVAPEKLDAYWPAISRELKKIRHTWERYWTLESLKYGVLRGNFQLWISGKEGEFSMVLFTQILQYPAGDILQAFLAFGKLEENIPVLAATMEHVARVAECSSFEIQGRAGWSRLLKKYRPCVVLTSLVFEVPKERLQ